MKNNNIYSKINNENIDFSLSHISNNDYLNKKLFLFDKNIVINKCFKIIFIYFYILIISLIKYLIPNNYYKIKLKNEIIDIEKYYKKCDKGFLNINKNFKKFENPKISIISAVYNNELFILRFLRSIQNQNYSDIEIILIDDFSNDNSADIIEKCQNEDERIILIKHNKNKGTLISRNEGILLSKGKYVLIPDSDDILSNNILNECISIVEKNDYDMIRFNIYLGDKTIFMYKDIKYLVGNSVFQPQLSSYIFYGKGFLKIIDPMISNKFLKRNILISALNNINDNYLNLNMVFYEDTLINFMLYKVSKSYYYLTNIGYYYINNPNSSTMGYKKNKLKFHKFMYSLFIFLKFILEYTKNNEYEKNMANEVIKKEMDVILSSISKIKKSKNFPFFEKIIILYLKNKYISLKTKKKLNNILKYNKIEKQSF